MRARFGAPDAHRTWNGVAPLRRPAGDQPLVTVCITHFNRPTELAAAIDSVRSQTYRNVEIVVVDDGSTLPEAGHYLDRLEANLAGKAERVLRQSNSFPGAARNNGVRNSKGEFILFMDDDNLAKPEEIAVFLQAADYYGTDILTCYADTFRGARPDEDKFCERLTAIGDAAGLGLYANCFGDSNCFVRRRVFETLGGFTEDYGIGLEDHEFFARAVLRGFKLMVVPEALYWYRISPVRIRDRHIDADAAQRRVLNAYLDNVPLALFEALQFAHDRRLREHYQSRHWPANVLLRKLAVKKDIRIIKASGLFDADYYLKTNPDVASSGMDPLQHFIRHGAYEARKPNQWFDPANYIEDHPGIIAAGVDPLVHFIRSGVVPPGPTGTAEKSTRGSAG